MSGFIIAFRIPNMLREMLAEGALGSSFTKVYSGLDTQDVAKANKFLIDSLLLMALFSGFICACGMIAAPFLVKLMTAESQSGPLLISTATGLTRLLFPFLGFMSLGAIISGGLHKKGAFFASASAPVIFNLCNIAGALLIAPFLESYGGAWVEEWIAPKAITGLALGVLLGGLGQLLVQAFDLRSELAAGFKLIRTNGISNPFTPEVKLMLLLMAPMALGAGGGQIKTVVNNYFATTQGPGAVVWLDAAFRLLHLPVGLFGIAISSAVLPTLSRALARAGGKVDHHASSEIQKAVELVLWLMVPCFIFLLVHHRELVQCLYETGRFTAEDSLQTSRALFAYSFAVLSYGLSRVMTSFYFALERTKFAFYVSLGNIALNIFANWLMVDRFGHVGLAWGYSLSQTIALGPMIWGMKGQGITLDKHKLVRSVAMLAGSGVVAGGGMILLEHFIFSPMVASGSRATAPLWLRAGIILAANAGFSSFVFGAGILFYFRKSPRAVWQMALKRLKSKK
jgi:putative peptidoglycan lipid II flippase